MEIHQRAETITLSSRLPGLTTRFSEQASAFGLFVYDELDFAAACR